MSEFHIISTSAPPPPSVATKFTTDDSNVVVPILHNINVFGGVGANTTGNVGTGTITINVKNDGFTWSEKNANFAAAIQNGYFCNAALTATLPASGGLVIGNTIIFFVDTASTVIVQAGAGEMIQVGSTISIPGGTTTSNTAGSILELVFKPSDLTWHTISSMGSWVTV